MNFKTAFYMMSGLYGLDCLFITPYILLKGLGQEVGLICSAGYNFIGISFFYIWFALFSFLLWFGLKFLFKFFDWRCEKLSIYPKLVTLLSWGYLMGWVIINNLSFIF